MAMTFHEIGTHQSTKIKYGAPYVLTHEMDKKFPPCSASFLEGLRLDSYNEKLKLAIGSQHYSLNSLYHKNRNGLDNQRKRDQKKREICKREGIDLIEVSYTCDLLPYIRTTLIEKGYIQNIDIE